ncbi:hypothetical protein [Caldisericum sp. AR60]|uniref:hypothetical protein n=1 Tax=Caldisericum sp. AR60 TaxID=3397852 RepID=UPI0039FD33F9
MELKKNAINNPSGTIKYISLYNISTGKIDYTIEIKKDWINIDKIEMNDNWILFKAVENPVGVPAECFAINKRLINLKL